MEEKRAPFKIQRIIQWVIVTGVLALAIFSVSQAIMHEMRERRTVFIGKAIFRADIADTPASRGKGFGGRDHIGEDEALLLVFGSDDKWPVVMKNRKSPVDLIWLDKDKKVVDIKHDVQPDAEPYRSHVPSEPARYIMEVSSGQAKSWGIATGMTARFEGLKAE